jgi:hypothetical protein
VVAVTNIEKQQPDVAMAVITKPIKFIIITGQAHATNN